MTMCEGCAVVFPNDALEVTAEGVRCGSCALQVKPRSRLSLSPQAMAAVAALTGSYFLDLSFSWGGEVTHTLHLNLLLGGPVAAILGLVAAVDGRRQGQPQSLLLGLVAALLGLGQFLWGLLALLGLAG